MAELLVIRHAQASFGADDYDKLSELGHVQSRLLGDLLKARGWQPDRIVTGALKRQDETLRSMGFEPDEVHDGFDEYDFYDLLSARFPDGVPDDVQQDRRTHFRTLRETILAWQSDELTGVKETWTDFADRVADALTHATRPGADKVMVISSGGPIGQMVASTLDAPTAQMMQLNLQVKNTSMTRFVFNDRVRYLSGFNETPHLDVPTHQDKVTFS
ncbi:MAG: histidine phosphatase family protein [Pseudomonadota bacterium]